MTLSLVAQALLIDPSDAIALKAFQDDVATCTDNADLLTAAKVLANKQMLILQQITWITDRLVELTDK